MDPKRKINKKENVLSMEASSNINLFFHLKKKIKREIMIATKS